VASQARNIQALAMTTILSGLAPATLYQTIAKNEPGFVGKFVAADSQATTDIAYFKANAAKFTSADRLMKDPRALGVVLTAFGLQDQQKYPALIKKVIAEDPNTASSVAYRTGNAAFARLGKALGQFTKPPFASAANVSALVAAYSQNRFESSEDAVSPGIGAALHFKNTIANVTSITQLMSDPKLVKVAVGGANLPSNFSALDYDKQVQLMTKAVDLKKFSNAGYVTHFVTNFLVNNSGTTISSGETAALSLLGGGNSTAAPDLLGALYPNAGTATGDIASTFYGLNSGAAAGLGNPTLALFA
jgi:hypothetical protein